MQQKTRHEHTGLWEGGREEGSEEAADKGLVRGSISEERRCLLRRREERCAGRLGVVFAIGAVSVVFAFFGLLVIPLDGLQLRERRGQAEGPS